MKAHFFRTSSWTINFPISKYADFLKAYVEILEKSIRKSKLQGLDVDSSPLSNGQNHRSLSYSYETLFEKYWVFLRFEVNGKLWMYFVVKKISRLF